MRHPGELLKRVFEVDGWACPTCGGRMRAGTVDDPLDSIQDAIDRTDTFVKVAAGTYREDLDFGGNDVTVESIEGPPTSLAIVRSLLRSTGPPVPPPVGADRGVHAGA